MALPPQTPAALDDIRVLDLAGEAGAYCAKLLADLGADVIKVEPPGGDATRHIGPFYHDEVDPEKSLYFFYMNTSKRSITLNIQTADGQALLKRLLPTADVLVESFPPGYMDGLGLGYQALSQINPRLIYVSITGFGLWGPHAHYKATDIVAVAMSGMMTLAGFPDDPPNRPYGNQAYYCASIQAATGVTMALFHRDRSGQGQLVEVSMQEALSMNQETAMQFWDIRREVRQRVGEARRLPGIGTYACRDGHMYLMIGAGGGGALGASWPILIQWMADEGMAEDLDSDQWRDFFNTLNLREIWAMRVRNDPALVELDAKFAHADEVLSRFLMRHTKQELYEEGQARGLLLGPVNTPKDLVESPHLNARGYFVEVEHPELGDRLRYPGNPYRLSETPWRIWRRPPRIGEHNEEIYLGELGLSRQQLAALSGAGVI